MGCPGPSGGFQFCGINIADLGLEYVPENANTYVYRPTKYNPHEESFDSHDGGYFYGMQAKPKDFTLRCFFEDQHLNSGALTRIFDVFKRGKTGRLIFDKRPWLWYDATVLDVDDSQIQNYMNGIIKISMRAYYPFARTTKTYIKDGKQHIKPDWVEPEEGVEYDESDKYYTETEEFDVNDLLVNSAMLVGVGFDLDKNFASDENFDNTLAASETIEMYNPGTEKAHCALIIAGNVGKGVRITNVTTGQICEVVGLSTTGQQILVIDSLSGKVLIKDSQNLQNPYSYGFLYHDNGFIDLASNYPVRRNIHLVGSNNTNVLSTDMPNIFSQDDIGKYVALYARGSSAVLGIAMLNNMILNDDSELEEHFFTARITQITDVDDHQEITLNQNLPANVSTNADITTTNIIQIQKMDENDQDVDIFTLRIKYMPTFS